METKTEFSAYELVNIFSQVREIKLSIGYIRDIRQALQYYKLGEAVDEKEIPFEAFDNDENPIFHRHEFDPSDKLIGSPHFYVNADFDRNLYAENAYQIKIKWFYPTIFYKLIKSKEIYFGINGFNELYASCYEQLESIKPMNPLCYVKMRGFLNIMFGICSSPNSTGVFLYALGKSPNPFTKLRHSLLFQLALENSLFYNVDRVYCATEEQTKTICNHLQKNEIKFDIEFYPKIQLSLNKRKILAFSDITKPPITK